MPNQSMRDFYEDLKTNSKLEVQYRTCDCDPEKIVKLATSNGYKFTLEELVEELGDMFCLDDLRAQKPEGDALYMAHPCLP